MLESHNVLFSGPLAGHADSVWRSLLEEGYSPLSSRNLLRAMAHLSRWMSRKGLSHKELSYARIDAFLVSRRRAGYTQFCRRSSVEAIVSQFRKAGFLGPEPRTVCRQSAVERLLGEYDRYLRDERTVVETTACRYVETARRFFCVRFDGERLQLKAIQAKDVTAFLLQDFRRYSTGSAKYTVTALRSIFRYLHVRGLISHDLTGAVPAVAGWRLSNLPKGLDQRQVRLLLRACNRRSAKGQLDYAILLLMLRLGLRACEVARLTLADINWESGELTIRGKGAYEDRLPLPRDVGIAIAAYLRHGRPRIDCRSIFMRMQAPSGPLTSHGIKARIYLCSVKAGLSGVSAHRLRHTAACEMLRNGSSLDEIAQVLRHKSHDTTAIYAKVDDRALRGVSQPWPGGVK